MKTWELLARFTLYVGFIMGFLYGVVTAWVTCAWPNPLPLLLPLFLVAAMVVYKGVKLYRVLRSLPEDLDEA